MGAETQARPVIANSWKRVELSGLLPSAPIDTIPIANFDRDSGLVAAATPVLDEMADVLGGIGYCVMLADRDSRVVETRWGRFSLRRRFETLGTLAGALFTESTTGTNSIATTYEVGHGVSVHGDEHFVEMLKPFSCYGYPLRHPVTKRLEGVLDITCLAADANPLLAPFLTHAARRIEERFLAGVRSADQHLLIAFQDAVTANRRRPAVALGDDVFLANDAAVELIDTADHALLREMAAGASTSQSRARRIRLSGGRTAVARIHQVIGPGTALITLEEIRTAERTPHQMAVPRAPVATLVQGERGSGVSTKARSLADGHALIFDAGELVGTRNAPWLDRVRAAMSSDGVVIVESIHLLPPSVARQVGTYVRDGRARIILTSGPADELGPEQRGLSAYCGRRVEIAPLRRRREEIPALVRALMDQMHASRDLRLTPSAAEALAACEWPGNIRELETVVVQILEHQSVGDITVADLPEAYRGRARARLLSPLEQAKRDAIVDTLRATGGDKKDAAARLGISRTTLYAAIRTFGIVTPSPRRR